MNSYTKIFEELCLPPVLARCADGTISSPLATFRAPAEWYGFPPALIPIWSDGSRPTYIGLWKHWFVERESSYVKMYVSSGRMTVEVARTAEQLLTLVAMMSLGERDGIEQDLVAFATEVGIENLDELNSVSLVSGDDPLGFVMIDQFKHKTPAESVSDFSHYNGEFPVAKFENSNPWWRKACSFEISPEILAAWPPGLAKPAWIDSDKEKLELFNGYLSVDNFENAWLTLNSSGWTIRDARAAISELNLRAKDRQFNLLANAWLSIADENAGGY